MRRPTAFRSCIAALFAATLFAAAAGPSPAAEGDGVGVPLPGPIAGNAVAYWRAGDGTVLGVARNGQIAYLEVSGIAIIGGTHFNGYGVEYEIDSEGCTVDHDLYRTASGFTRTAYEANVAGKATYPGKLISSQLVVTSTLTFGGGKFRLVNVVRWKPGSLDIVVRQTFTNLTGTSYGTFKTKYFVDVDVPTGWYSPATVSNFSRTKFGVTAWNDGSLAASLRTEATVEAYVTEAYDYFDPPVGVCGDGAGNLAGGAEPNVWRGNGAFGIRNWNFGIAAHGTERAWYRLEVRR